MAAKPKKNLGKMPCPNCGQPVAVKQADSGTLSYTCQEADCEGTGYAQAHTKLAGKWHAALGTCQAPPAPTKKPAAPQPPKADAEQPPKADAKPSEQPPKKGGFSLSGVGK